MSNLLWVFVFYFLSQAAPVNKPAIFFILPKYEACIKQLFLIYICVYLNDQINVHIIHSFSKF